MSMKVIEGPAAGARSAVKGRSRIATRRKDRNTERRGRRQILNSRNLSSELEEWIIGWGEVLRQRAVRAGPVALYSRATQRRVERVTEPRTEQRAAKRFSAERVPERSKRDHPTRGTVHWVVPLTALRDSLR